jgi:hypothetical protein
MDSGNLRVSHTAEPPTQFRVVTPTDGLSLALTGTAIYPRGLWIGVTGNLSIIGMDDTAAVTISNVPVGYWSGRVKSVQAATTATNIVAVY